MFSETIKAKVSPKALLTGAKVLAVLLLAGCLFWAGRSSVKTRTVEREVVREVQVTLDQKALKEMQNNITEQVRGELDSSHKAASSTAGKSSSNSTTKIIETTRIIDRDPATGQVIRETTTDKTTDTGESKHEETASNTQVDDTTKETVEVVKVDNSKTTETTQTSQTSTEKTKESEKITEKPADAVPPPSPLGIAINMKANPMVTYDLVKVWKFAGAATAEIELKDKPGIRSVGGALLADVNKRNDYFVGIYDTYNLHKKGNEVGIMFGRRF